MGIEADVHRQILGFKESANALRVVLNNLYNRGSQEVLLGVFDGLTGWIQHFGKYIRRPMYSTGKNYNEHFEKRVIRGFGNHKAKKKLNVVSFSGLFYH